MFVMGDDNQRAPVLPGHVEQQLNDRLAGVRVEVSRRLVRVEDGGIVDERARDGDTLLLAPAEFGGEVLQAVLEADTLQKSLLRGCGAAFPPSSRAGRHFRER